MKALVAALERIATALEQLVPAVQQATREARRVEPTVNNKTATHTNYNTGEPCYCDVRFDFIPGPCIDEEPMVGGADPVNGIG